jgi:hypothetical protein
MGVRLAWVDVVWGDAAMWFGAMQSLIIRPAVDAAGVAEARGVLPRRDKAARA